MGIEPTRGLLDPTLVLKTRGTTRHQSPPQISKTAFQGRFLTSAPNYTGSSTRIEEPIAGRSPPIRLFERFTGLFVESKRRRTAKTDAHQGRLGDFRISKALGAGLLDVGFQ